MMMEPSAHKLSETAIMRRHPAKAREMLESVRFLRRAIEIPGCHHERWDGSGYPKGFTGEEIPSEGTVDAQNTGNLNK